MLVCWIALLAAVSGTCSARATYVVTCPSKLYAGSVFNVTVSFLVPVTDVVAEVSLMTKDNSQTVTSHRVTLKDPTSMIPVKLPASVATGAYSLKVTATGDGVSIDRSNAVKVVHQSSLVLIQTDKAIYKPGQTVKYRIVVLDANTLLPRDAAVEVHVLDSQENKVIRWAERTKSYGVLSKEFRLSEYPMMGQWRIRATVMDKSTEKEFTVAEYVLPMFEVKVAMSPVVLAAATRLTGSVSARYTYGKAVKGHAVIRVRQVESTPDEDVVETLEIDGKSTFSIAFVPKPWLGNVEVECNVTESLTGVSLTQSTSLSIVNSEVELTLSPINPGTFKPGLDYAGQVIVKTHDGSPLTKDRLNITLTASSYSEGIDGIRNIYELTVPDDGVVPFHVLTWKNATILSLQFNYGGQWTWQWTIGRYWSPSQSCLQLALQDGSKAAGQRGMVEFLVESNEPDVVVLYQVFTYRDMLIRAGSVKLDGHRTTIRIPTTPTMAPHSRVVAFYVRNDGELVTDALDFKVSGSGLNHRVAIAVDPAETSPGKEVTIQVRSSPQSFVGLLAVDESVLLLKSGNDLSAQQVSSQFVDSDLMEFTSFYHPFTSKDVIDKTGLVVITDANIPDEGPNDISFNEEDDAVYDDASKQTDAVDSAVHLAAVDDVRPRDVEPVKARKLFPETWIFADFVANEQGWSTYKAQVPDSLTSWVLSAFAVSKSEGLGIADKAKIRVLQPFFISLNLPYSVVRGEEVGVQVTLFNYFDFDLLDMTVKLEKSDEFEFISASGNELEVTPKMKNAMTIDVKRIPAQDGRSVSFPIRATKIGQLVLRVEARSGLTVDAVEKTLLVKPEGVEKVLTRSVLANLLHIDTMSMPLELTLPAKIVPDSVRTTISVSGDILGPSIEGLDRLVQMPSGCGEQNMIKLVPNIFVAEYLESVDALNGGMKQKVMDHMQEGYQRQLGYRHSGTGGYSAFGEDDSSASSWLTAFVVRSFRAASRFIFIDNALQQTAMRWLLSLQNDDGSFEEPGTVITPSLSSEDSQVTLTAHVLISLLEDQANSSSDVLKAAGRAAAYLEKALPNINEVYALSITAYALQLPGITAAADAVFHKLQSKAVNKGDLQFWPGTKGLGDVESTSYALLCYLRRGLLEKALPILRWLVSKRSALGGYDSTKSTMLALQALSEYAQLIHSDTTSMEVSLEAVGKKNAFSLNDENAMLMQTWEIGGPVPAMNFKATGHGIAVVQMSTYFNVYNTPLDSHLELSVSLPEDTLNAITVRACVRSKLDDTGMALLEVSPLGGFAVAEKELKELVAERSVRLLQRAEVTEGKAALYFDKIDSVEVCVPVKMTRVQAVAKPQRASVLLYDYYAPELYRRAWIESAVLKDANLCAVCEDCSGC